MGPAEKAKIVAIGGGEIGRPGYPVETLVLDAEVVRLTGKKRPRVVFLPTATVDDAGYVAVVEEHYGKRLGCEVVPLPLFDRSLSVSSRSLASSGQPTSCTSVGATRCE